MTNNKYFKEFPKLESSRLLLRKLSLEDAGDIQQIRSNNQVMNYMDSEAHLSLKDSEKFIAENLQKYDQQIGLFWALIEKSSGKFLGDFAFWEFDRKNSRAEIGYTLKPEFWGKGFMKEAMNRILQFGFEELNLHSIEANINPANDNSRRLLMRLGFKKEAYFRKNYFFQDKYLDSEIYSLLRSDFQTG